MNNDKNSLIDNPIGGLQNAYISGRACCTAFQKVSSKR